MARQLGSSHGDSRAIDAEVQGRGKGAAGEGFRMLPLVVGDLGSQRLGGSLHLLGLHLDPGQFAEQLAALFEAH